MLNENSGFNPNFAVEEINQERSYPVDHLPEKQETLPPEELKKLIKQIIKYLTNRIREEVFKGNQLAKENYRVAINILEEELNKL